MNGIKVTENEVFTCFFCRMEMKCPPDIIEKKCNCGSTIIQHTKWYTHFLRAIPVEKLNNETERHYEKMKLNHNTSSRKNVDDSKHDS